MCHYTVIVLQIYSAVLCEQDDNKRSNTDKIGVWCVLCFYFDLCIEVQVDW